MTPNEHDIPETTEGRKTTELYPFSVGYPGGTDRAIDDTVPDIPVMEQLPDPDALPDPGSPEMPASAGDYASGTMEPPPPFFHPSAPEQPSQPTEPPRQV